MNDASSNKTQYHNINNIYFQAKLQPGLLIPVIKANGSSAIISASLEPTVHVLKQCIIFFLSQPAEKQGDQADPHTLFSSQERYSTDQAQSKTTSGAATLLKAFLAVK